MANLAVIVAVIQDEKILLTKREDFEIWCLPGGIVDENESLAEASIREIREGDRRGSGTRCSGGCVFTPGWCKG